jgi:lipid-binding SYLF domain-containing protein
LTAGILAWSRSRGAFAGLTVGGGTLRNDLDQNKEIYGKPLMNKEILQGNIKPPESALALVSSLNRLSREEGQRARPADAK